MGSFVMGGRCWAICSRWDKPQSSEECGWFDLQVDLVEREDVPKDKIEMPLGPYGRSGISMTPAVVTATAASPALGGFDRLPHRAARLCTRCPSSAETR